jgi:hypothetical protein
MFTRISHDRDFTPALNDRDTYAYLNTYVPVADLKDDDDVGQAILRLVKGYDPATQAVVVIEYEPGCSLEPEVIQIRGGHLKETITPLKT